MGKRILIVDNNSIAQLTEKTLLELSGLSGLTVDCADSGEMALSLVEKCHYDLILMELGLPGIDGIETTRKIKAYEIANNFPHVPVVAVTVHASEKNKSLFLAAGMSEMIGKSLGFNHAIYLVKKYLH